MSKSEGKHWDAAGHPVWDYFTLCQVTEGMTGHELVKTHPLHKIIIEPNVRLMIILGKTSFWVLYREGVGPGTSRTIVPSETMIEGLRKLYRKIKREPGGKNFKGWELREGKNSLEFIRKGRIYLDPLRRFGVWS